MVVEIGEHLNTRFDSQFSRMSPDILDRAEFRAFRRQRNDTNVSSE
ncbi:MAG: hypothetical protein K0S56_1235 [Microvirga sp.]|jgi:hypothetical protein|nr:hypothetical protein [Microvirga sp.]